MFFGIDPLYIVMMLPMLLISIYVSFRVKSAFNKYSRYAANSGVTGAETARRILRSRGLIDVQVKRTRGFLSDHYDPGKKEIRLSPKIYDGNSIASIGIAAHETGHAVQHAGKYSPLMLRNIIAPAASIGSNFAWIIIIVGFIFGLLGLVKAGIVLFSVVVLFQLVTLPVEFNASSRAKEILYSEGILTSHELAGAGKVLSAAAMTYVAAAASAITTLLYFLLRSGFLGGSDD